MNNLTAIFQKARAFFGMNEDATEVEVDQKMGEFVGQYKNLEDFTQSIKDQAATAVANETEDLQKRVETAEKSATDANQSISDMQASFEQKIQALTDQIKTLSTAVETQNKAIATEIAGVKANLKSSQEEGGEGLNLPKKTEVKNGVTVVPTSSLKEWMNN